jgi:hypothetical protein
MAHTEQLVLRYMGALTRGPLSAEGDAAGEGRCTSFQGWLPELLHAHREAFCSNANAAWALWKYGSGEGVGAGLWDGKKLAAFCGAVPRRLWWEGRALSGLQITDVMVRKPWRQAGRGGGAFARVSGALYEAALGSTEQSGATVVAATAVALEAPVAAVGFGFPSHRHLKLAQRLGLLRDGGAITAAAWTAAARPVATALQRQHARGAAALELVALEPTEALTAARHGWHQMKPALRGHVVGDRGWGTLDWRYRACPPDSSTGTIVWLGLRRPRHAAPWGVIVLRKANSQALWLDWIGPPDGIALAWAHALDWTLAQGFGELHGWFSDAPWERLMHTLPAATTEAARLGVPVAGQVSDAALSRSRWWLMAGDTDFL